MDNQNDLASSILQSSDTSLQPFGSSSSGSSNSSSWFFGNINITTWLIIVLILAFLGFNVFVYLAKGTQDITNFFGPLFKSIFGTTLGATSQIVDVSAEGAKAVVKGTSNTIESGLTAIQNITPNNPSSTIKPQTIQGSNPSTKISGENSTLNTAQKNEPDYQADVASSSVHGGKAGWCYIGEERGVRTCASVGANDQCMSGDIFPTQEICMNPNLRV